MLKVMTEGIYEELVTQLVTQKINSIGDINFYINRSKLDKEEASSVLSKHLAHTIKNALNIIKGENQIEL
jgi:nitrogen-specific signal transduction histidine kinase